MLKLEKSSRNRDIHVTLRDKDRFISREFLMALSCAVGMHVFAIILFNVSPIKILYNQSSNMPMLVETDLLTGDPQLAVVSSDIDNPHDHSRYFHAPKRSIPALPDSPDTPFVRMEYIKEKSLLTNPFLDMETDFLVQNLFARKESNQVIPLQIHLSGGLSNEDLNNRELSKQPFFQLLQPKIAHSDSFSTDRAIYAVEVDNKSGKIFWYEPKEKAVNDRNRSRAEQILKALQFKQDQKYFMTSGLIEIMFTEDTLEESS